MSDADTTVDDGQATLPGVETPPEPPKPDPELEAARAKLARHEAAEKKRKADEKLAADQKRIDNEGAKGVLAEREAELAALNERLAAFEKAESDRAQRLFDALPEDNRKRLEQFRERMATTSDWVALVESESQIIGAGAPEPKAPTPPPTGAPMAGRKPASGHEANPKSIEIIENYTMFGSDIFKRNGMHATRDPESGATVFTIDKKQMFRQMRGGRVGELDHESGKMKK